MKKAVKLILCLVLAAVLCGALWVSMESPRLSAEAAFRRMESRQLLPKSRFVEAEGCGQIQILGGKNSGLYQQYTAAGVTESHVHLAYLQKKSFWWYSHDRHRDQNMISLPVEGDLTAGILPWRLEGVWHGFFVYTPLEGDRYSVTLTVGDTVFTHTMPARPSGFTPFSIPSLGETPHLEDEIGVRGYDLVGVGYGKDRKSRDVTLEVILYDENGQPLARTQVEYPAQSQ